MKYARECVNFSPFESWKKFLYKKNLSPEAIFKFQTKLPSHKMATQTNAKRETSTQKFSRFLRKQNFSLSLSANFGETSRFFPGCETDAEINRRRLVSTAGPFVRSLSIVSMTVYMYTQETTATGDSSCIDGPETRARYPLGTFLHR